MKFFSPFIFPLLLLFCFSAQSQTCSGNLGENVFTDGDFGSGTENVVQVNPNIAPGYFYRRNPPPQDGQYTVTNDMAVWSEANGWIRISDNSSDPNGYMMVVNASFFPGLFYEKTIDNLCENTLYEFSADIINLIPTGRNIIKPNISFLINGDRKYTTGKIPEDETWKTYGFSFKTEPGQTSITLALRNNAPGGIGNDVALDNISFRACGPNVSIELVSEMEPCSSEEPVQLLASIDDSQANDHFIQWQRRQDSTQDWQSIPEARDSIFSFLNLNARNEYYRVLFASSESALNNEKCRIISDEFHLIVPSFEVNISDTICQGSFISIGNKKFSETGQYSEKLKTKNGCDSIVNLDLTVLPNSKLDIFTSQENPQCHDTNDGIIRIDSVQGGAQPISLSFNDEPFSLPTEFNNLSQGYYKIKAVDNFGCKGDTTIWIANPKEFIVDIGDSISIDLGDYAFVRPESVSNYINTIKWLYNDESFYCDRCWPLIWTPSENGILTLVADNNRGCIATDSIKINVNPVYRVYFPNIFSPNNDGKNDGFTVFGHIPNIKWIDEFIVYNRWGNKVFEKKQFDPNVDKQGWDGSYNGENLSPDTYIYTARVLFLDGLKKSYQGQVQLIR